MDTLLSIKVFCRVVETGSFVAAAHHLGLSAAMASRHIAHLEQHVGARLLNRNTRRLSLTEGGNQYFAYCQGMLQQLEAVESVVGHHTAAPRGLLRLTAPVPFGVRHLVNPLERYMQQYPDVELKLHLSDKEEDLAEEAFDLALRVGYRTNPSLIARKLCPVHLVLVCSPGYAARYGLAQTPGDLLKHKTISYSYLTDEDHWNFSTPEGTISQQINPVMRVNNGDMAVAAAVAGLGIASQPTFIAADELRSGRLIQVLPQYRQVEPALYAVYLSRQFLSAKVRTFIDFMVDWFQPDAEWDKGLPDIHP
jgi:DNA-binding transcriptional LysR family regulator